MKYSAFASGSSQCSRNHFTCAGSVGLVGSSKSRSIGVIWRIESVLSGISSVLRHSSFFCLSMLLFVSSSRRARSISTSNWSLSNANRDETTSDISMERVPTSTGCCFV